VGSVALHVPHLGSHPNFRFRTVSPSPPSPLHFRLSNFADSHQIEEFDNTVSTRPPLHLCVSQDHITTESEYLQMFFLSVEVEEEIFLGLIKERFLLGSDFCTVFEDWIWRMGLYSSWKRNLTRSVVDY
jgi:hypothetical protein